VLTATTVPTVLRVLMETTELTDRTVPTARKAPLARRVPLVRKDPRATPALTDPRDRKVNRAPLLGWKGQQAYSQMYL
jgi:hypothetical protein